MKPVWVWLALFVSLPAVAEVLPLIDAHSQFDDDTPFPKLIQEASRAGISRVILSARGGTTFAEVLELAEKHPGCVVPSVRTKGRAYAANEARWYSQLDEQLKRSEERRVGKERRERR